MLLKRPSRPSPTSLSSSSLEEGSAFPFSELISPHLSELESESSKELSTGLVELFPEDVSDVDVDISVTYADVERRWSDAAVNWR